MILSRHTSLGRDVIFQSFGLSTAKRRQNIRQAKVEANFVVDVLDRIIFSLRGQVSGFSCEDFIVCDDHPTATRRDQLVPVEARATQVAQAAHQLVLVLGSQRFGGIFHDEQIEAARQFQNGVHVHRMAKDVNRLDRADSPSRLSIAQRTVAPVAALGQKVFDQAGVHLPVPRFGVDEDGPRIRVPDGIGRRDERQCRAEHFVIRLDAADFQCNVQGRRAVDRGDGVLRSHPFGDHLFKPIDVSPDRANPAGVDAILNVLPLVARDLRHAERDHFGGHGAARFRRCRHRRDTSRGCSSSTQWSS